MLRFLLRSTLFLILLLILVLICFRIAAGVRESQDPQALAPKTGSFVSTPSGSFYTLEAGNLDAIPVLLAHGTAAWSGFWQKEVDQIGAIGPYRAIAFDMPPFGFSQRPTNGDYSRTAQATRILDFVATLDTAPIMVAHSFGAAATTEAVLRNPTAFRGLIIVDGAIGMNPSPINRPLPLPIRPMAFRKTALAATATNPWATKTLLRSMMYNKAAASAARVSTLQTPMRLTGTTTAYAEWLPALLAPQATSLSRTPASYANLPIPVRIIWGDKDAVTPPSQAEALAAALDQGPVHYLKDVGHIPHIEAPDAFMAALLAALEGMTPSQ